MAQSSKLKTQIGDKFGWLTVVKGPIRRRARCGPIRLFYECECVCGNHKTVRVLDLRAGGHQSCGCRKGSLISKKKMTHGLTNTHEFKVWSMMKTRCSNNKFNGFEYYGGRGIKVCGRWQKFENFFADMGICPPGYTIERKNNNLGYNPENCQWASYLDQANNKRNNHNITAHGKTQSLSAWSREVGVSRAAIRNRIARGLSPEQSLKPRIKKILSNSR